MLYLMTQIWLQLVLAFALGGVAAWWWLARDPDVPAEAEEGKSVPRPEASPVESLRLQLEAARSDARAAREALAARTRELRELRGAGGDGSRSRPPEAEEGPPARTAREDVLDTGPGAPAPPEGRAAYTEAAVRRGKPPGPRLPDALIERADVGSPGRDDLTRIRGVGPVLEKLLNEMGIHTFREIADWTAEDVERIQARLPRFPGRIRRDDWIRQAAELDRNAS